MLFLQVHPIRIANCNLHGPSTRAGITGLVDKLELKQYVGTSSRSQMPSGGYVTGSQPGKLSLDKWLEAGGFSLGPIMLEAAMALPHPLLYQVCKLLVQFKEKKNDYNSHLSECRGAFFFFLQKSVKMWRVQGENRKCQFLPFWEIDNLELDLFS